MGRNTRRVKTRDPFFLLWLFGMDRSAPVPDMRTNWKKKKLRGGFFKSFFDAMFEGWQGVVVVGCRGKASISFCLLDMHVF